jgi:hypothetical protein
VGAGRAGAAWAGVGAAAAGGACAANLNPQVPAKTAKTIAGKLSEAINRSIVRNIGMANLISRASSRGEDETAQEYRFMPV